MRAPSLLLAATALVVAGCGGSEPGTPTTADGTTRTAAPSSEARPARPQPLDLATADPCRLVTEQQSAAWGVDRAPQPDTAGGGSVLAGAKSCAYGSSAQQTGFLITTGTTVGLDEYLDATGPHPAARNTEVDGFPTVVEEGRTSFPDRGSGECYALVDVADGQLLSVQFSQIAASQDKRLPIESLCAKAEEVAAAALTTLQGG